MEKTQNMPVWVFLAFMSIETRKAALILIGASAAFSVYCIPWSLFFGASAWVTTVFLIDDWSWFAMMVPITLWYWLSMRWIDNNNHWPDIPAVQEP